MDERTIRLNELRREDMMRYADAARLASSIQPQGKPMLKNITCGLGHTLITLGSKLAPDQDATPIATPRIRRV